MDRELQMNEQEIQTLTVNTNLERIRQRIEEGTGLPTGTLTPPLRPLAGAPNPSNTEAPEAEDLAPSSVPFSAPTNNHRRRHSRKLFFSVAAALIAILLLGTMAYAWQSGYLTSFFGEDSGVPLTQVISPRKTVTDDGLIITLEEILPGEAGGLVVLSFAWEDGRAFPEETPMVGELMAGTEGSYWNFVSMQFQLRDDNKQLLCFYESRNTEQIVGQELVVFGDTLYTSTFEEVPLATNLQDYLNATGYTLSKSEAQVARESVLAQLADATVDPVDLNVLNEDSENEDENIWITHWLAEQSTTEETADLLTLPYPEIETNYSLNGMLLIEDCLYVSGTYTISTERRHDRNSAGIHKLLDTRTGQMRNYDLGSSGIVGFSGIKASDLPYLVPVVDYNINEVLTTASWHFTQQIEDTGQITRIPLTDIIAPRLDVDDPWQLTEAVITPMEVVLYGEYLQADDIDWLPQGYWSEITLILNDGSQIAMKQSSGGLNEPGGRTNTDEPAGFYFTYQINQSEYQLTDDEEDSPLRLFINDALRAELAYLLIDGQEVPLD